MKKKVTAIALAVCILAVAVIGATMAYFTDTDSKTNTFTFGKVDIDLTEESIEDKEEGVKAGTVGTDGLAADAFLPHHLERLAEHQSGQRGHDGLENLIAK